MPSTSEAAPALRRARAARRLVLALAVLAVSNVALFPLLNGAWFQGPFDTYWPLRDLGDDRLFSVAREDANPAVDGRLAIYLGLRRVAEDHPLIWFPDAFVDPYYVTAFARTEGIEVDYDPSISRTEAQRLAGLAQVRISSRTEERDVLIVAPRGDPDEPLRLLRWGEKFFFFVPETLAVEYLDETGSDA